MLGLRGPKLSECFRPMLGFKDGVTDSGADHYRWVFIDRVKSADERQKWVKMLPKADVVIPCGKCDSCVTQRAGEWSMRCYHEQVMQPRSGLFVTATYSDDHNPVTLVPADFDNFIQNVRRRWPDETIRYFSCGEYGSKDKTERPHFHLCLWGVPLEPDDKYFASKSVKGNPQYFSPELQKCWQEKGRVTFSNFEPSCAGYTASYVVDRWSDREGAQLGPNGYRRDERFTPTGEIIQLAKPFQRQSLKPAIGRAWYEKNWRDLQHGFVVFNGKPRRIPRTYMRWLEREHPSVAERVKAKAQKFIESRGYFEGDSTCERLEAREKAVQAAKKGVWKRS